MPTRAAGVPPSHRRKARRGGARNRRDRMTAALSTRHVGGMIDAAGFAVARGSPLTRHITVHWKAAGVPASRAGAATSAFVRWLARFARERGAPVAWLYVREDGPGKGAHSHILAHVPPALALTLSRAQRAWLARYIGAPYPPGAIRSRPIGPRVTSYSRNPAAYRVNLAAIVSYLAKGADNDAAATYGLARRESGGTVTGKRVGCSQSLGPAARANVSQAIVATRENAPFETCTGFPANDRATAPQPRVKARLAQSLR